MLRKYNDFSNWIDGEKPYQTLSIIGEQHGQFSLMFALVHPEIQLHVFCYNAEDAALIETALSQICIKNITVHIAEDEKTAAENANALNSSLINLSEILG